MFSFSFPFVRARSDQLGLIARESKVDPLEDQSRVDQQRAVKLHWRDRRAANSPNKGTKPLNRLPNYFLENEMQTSHGD
jgi:hypothetical protein